MPAIGARTTAGSTGSAPSFSGGGAVAAGSRALGPTPTPAGGGARGGAGGGAPGSGGGGAFAAGRRVGVRPPGGGGPPDRLGGRVAPGLRGRPPGWAGWASPPGPPPHISGGAPATPAVVL